MPFSRSLVPILRDALIVGLLTALALTLAYQVRSRIFIELGSIRDNLFLERFFGDENDQTQTYRWTRENARFALEGQALPAPWILTLRLNGYRPNRLANVEVSANNSPLQAFQASGEWGLYDMEGDARSDPWTGTTTFEIASDTFTPSALDATNPDTRALGVALDWAEWAPARSSSTIGDAEHWIDFGTAPVVPPFGIVLGWAGAFALLYATARGIGLAARPVNIAFAILIVLLAVGIALMRPYVATFTVAFLTLSVVLAALAFGLLLLVPRVAARMHLALDAKSLAVLAGIVLLSIGMKWGGTWYPQFRSSDLTFHVHRLEFVERGEIFFTSELPDAARRVVPYPPALYVTLSPLAPFVPDFPALILVGNALFDAIAILAVYFTARQLGAQAKTNDMQLALFAAFLFAINPVSFWIYSWGNHTNIFGQVAATLLFCLLMTQPVARTRNFLLALFLFLLASAAHLGVFLSLLAFFPLAAVLRFLSKDPNAKRESMALVGLLVAGVVIAFGLYYAEFAGDLLAQTQAFLSDFGAGRAAAETGVTVKRITDVVRYTYDQVGWVLLLGGIVGIPLALKTFPSRPRAMWLAWLVVALVFGLVTIGSSFSTRYTLWAAPALACSAGLVMVWLAEKSRAAQVAAYGL